MWMTLPVDVLGLVAQAVDQDAAADGAVRTGVAGFGSARQLELAHLRQRIVGREAQHRQAGSAQSAGADFEELPSGDLHFFASLSM